MDKLTREEVQAFLAGAADSFPHDACLTCECFLGYATQLRVDADAGGRELVAKYQTDLKSTHSCLGCDPCPPGDLYAEYMRDKKGPGLIRLV